MGCKQIAAMGMVSVLLGAGALLASANVAAANVASASVVRKAPKACLKARDDKWPAWTHGRPAGIDPKTAAGAYMWHDGLGWHIRVTHRGGARRTFTGRIVTTGRFVGVTSVRLEGHDVLTVSADHRTITFWFGNYGAVDGLNFRTVCASSVGFGFTSDGEVMPTDKITIGHGAANPATDPFEITRP